MFSIQSLPDSIYFYLIEFLNCSDQNSFASMNKASMNNILYFIRQFEIRNDKSLKEMSKKFLYQNAKSLFRQLRLQIVDNFSDTDADLERLLENKDISCNQLITDISSFQDKFLSGKYNLMKVNKFELQSCWAVRFSTTVTTVLAHLAAYQNQLGLKHVKTYTSETTIPLIPHLESLHVVSASQLIDISQYSYLRKLKLCKCNSIVDFSALDNIYDLEINACGSFEDASVLNHNHSIKIIDCKPTDFRKCFQFSRNITIHGKNGPIDVDLSYYERLQVFHADSIHESLVSENRVVPNSLRILSLVSPVVVSSHSIVVPSAPNLDVTIFHTHVISNQLNLENLYKLSLHGGKDTVPVTSLADFGEKIGKIPVLEFFYFMALVDISILGKGNKSITFSFCYSLTNISPLRHVDHVKLHMCNKFSDVSQLSHVKHLEIYTCAHVFSIQGLSHVHHLTLQHEMGSVQAFYTFQGVEDIPIVDVRDLKIRDPTFAHFKNNHKVIVPSDWVKYKIGGFEEFQVNYCPPQMMGKACVFLRK